VGHVLLVHASADKPEAWRYVDGERAARACLDAAKAHGLAGVLDPHVLVGHVHHQTLYYQGAGRGLMPFKPTPGVAVPLPRSRACVATVGSVGQPRDGDPRAMYALYDISAGRMTFQRVPYDHAAAAQAIRQAGLPEYFAHRLETGR
jgi:diadenosine tetraphosphatase ApaH/serine/threonine PP2A family protein phosphatase